MNKIMLLKKSVAGFSLLEVLVVLALTTLILVSFGARFADVTEYVPRFSTTCLMMEEIKEALVGKHDYSGGIRQFSGYISDMGTMPSLFYKDEDGEIHRLNKTESIGHIIDTAKTLPQPVALWSWDFKQDGSGEIPPRLLWQYHPDEKIWAGWKGPYLKPPERGFLEDAWGNQFLFFLGNLVSLQEDPDAPDSPVKTYRCIKTHILSSDKNSVLTPPAPGPRKPGTVDGREFWEELVDGDDEPFYINAHFWVELEKMPPNNNRQDIYYDDVLTIISFGKDGKPGCGKMDRIISRNDGLETVEWQCKDQYDKDLIITIYREEYAAEVAGHAGYKNETVEQLFARALTLCYPRFDDTENGGGIEQTIINLSLTDINGECADKGYGINFRFGTVLARAADSFRCVDCQSEPAGCVCIDYEQTCVKWSCTGSTSCAYQGSDWMGDFLNPCPYDDYTPCLRNVVCDYEYLCFAGTQCIEYEEGDCLAYRCDEEPDLATSCNCSGYYEFTTDKNSAYAEMTHGVRSIITDTDKTIIFPAGEGANYLGTIK